MSGPTNGVSLGTATLDSVSLAASCCWQSRAAVMETLALYRGGRPAVPEGLEGQVAGAAHTALPCGGHAPPKCHLA